MEEIYIEIWQKMQANRVLNKWNISFLYSIKMIKKTLKFDKVEVNEKEFHVSKQPAVSDSVLINQLVVSEKFEYSGTGFRYSVGYKDDNVIGPLCIILTLNEWLHKTFS